MRDIRFTNINLKDMTYDQTYKQDVLQGAAKSHNTIEMAHVDDIKAEIEKCKTAYHAIIKKDTESRKALHDLLLSKGLGQNYRFVYDKVLYRVEYASCPFEEGTHYLYPYEEECSFF